MKRLFAPSSLERVSQATRGELLLAFDYDGTLAPIVAERQRAEMRVSTARLLVRLARLYPTAVVSGRSRADVVRRLAGAEVKHVIGNHGLEPGTDLDLFADEIEAARRSLEVALRDSPGVEIEDKRYSLSLHYRRAHRRALALAAIERAVADLPHPMRLVPGKLVANVVPTRAPNKGDAVLALRAKEGVAAVIYVGDDVTDEDVFRLGEPERPISVRVGPSKSSAAEYYLADQREMDALLFELIRLRSPSPTTRGPSTPP